MSMDKRISEIEKQLKKYSINKKASEDLRSISFNIKERIRILDSVHSELVSISEELYYYDMIDYLGNLKIDSLNLKQCIIILKELENASIKFAADKDERYMHLCDKTHKRVTAICMNMGKEIIKNKSRDQVFIEFFRSSPEEVKQKFLKYYFNEQKKILGKALKAAAENPGKTWHLLILGEVTQFKIIFGDILDESYESQPTAVEHLKDFDRYIYDLFENSIFNQKNEELAASIYERALAENNDSIESKIFVMIFKLYKNSSNRNNQCIKSQAYIEL